MLLTCPICRAECTVDNLSVDTVTCPTCGQQLSTRTGTPPVSQVVIGDTPAEKDETRAWREDVALPTADIDVLPVRLGRYFIESLIAQGGFAKVYLATDEELGRRVALKIPRNEKFKTSAKLREFLAEARIAAKLRHPGVVTIFDVGQFANGTNYIAMEYVAGQPLSDIIHAGRVPVPRAVDLLIKVAEAVHYAHSQGLVHRDLKPGNILLDERGEPRVVDFGLAVHETSQAKMQGEVAGTPAFMSPEQFRGEVHRLDGRTDIWSLGCVFYQLLTGRRPFNGDVNQLYDEVLNKAPKPPRQIDDQIPRELEVICFKCLSKSVEDRYATAKDLADELRGCTSNLKPASPEAIPRLPQPVRVRKFPVRMATILAGVSIAVLFAVVVGLKNPTSARLTTFNLDQRAIRNEWIPMLDAKVVPLVWDASHPTESWNQDRHNVTMDCSGAALLSIGETNSQNFIVQALIGRSQWANSQGQAGLFLGWQPIENPDGYKGYRCVIVTVLSVRNGAETNHRLDIHPWDVFPIANSTNPSIQKNNGNTIDVPAPEPQNLLEVQVRRGMIVSVKWQNVEFSELLTDMSCPPVATAGAKSQIGVINSRGAAIFSDVRFKLLD